MQLHALHVGINDYRGTDNDLDGCVNDALDCARLFGRRHKGTRRDAIDALPFFPEAASQVVLVNRQAVRVRILAELQKLLKRLRLGDLGVFTFSGHGTYVKDKNGDEPDGHDEALVAADLDVIVDDELAVLLERRAPGSRLLVQTDACHSGTATRSLGPRLLGPTDRSHRVRFLPPRAIPRHKLEGWRTARMQRTAKLVDVIHFGACRDNQFAGARRAEARCDVRRLAGRARTATARRRIRPGATNQRVCPRAGLEDPASLLTPRPTPMVMSAIYTKLLLPASIVGLLAAAEMELGSWTQLGVAGVSLFMV